MASLRERTPQMHQLTGLDASFLNMESGPVYGHVSSLCIYDSPNAAEPLTLERVRARMASRLHRMPMFRRKLVEVPMNLDHPYWVDSPTFDIDDHIYGVGLPVPGSREQLNDLVTRIVAKPLDRSRPLWELVVIDGLTDGTVAVLTIVHHAQIDGASGTDLMGTMLDRDPGIEVVTPEPVPWTPEATPDPMTLLTSAVAANALRPFKAVQLQWEVLTHFATWPPGGALPEMLSRPIANPSGPRTPFNTRPTNRRAFAPFRVPLAEVKAIKSEFGATVNDVVMAICAGGVRRWLADRGALPTGPLKAAVPVSIRTADDKGSMGNKVSMIMADLPTHLSDPVERLAAVSSAMQVAKTEHGALPVQSIIGFSDFAVPAIAATAARELQRTNLSGHVMPANVVISNVPGPQKPMFLAGAELLEFYPVSMIADGQALNITLHSYNGSLDFGLIGCPRAVPDIERMAEYILDEHQLLLERMVPEQP